MTYRGVGGGRLVLVLFPMKSRLFGLFLLLVAGALYLTGMAVGAVAILVLAMVAELLGWVRLLGIGRNRE